MHLRRLDAETKDRNRRFDLRGDHPVDQQVTQIQGALESLRCIAVGTTIHVRRAVLRDYGNGGRQRIDVACRRRSDRDAVGDARK
jgi:hypothetical protein